MALSYEDLTNKIIKAFYNVYNELGYGFFEKVYENSMLIELREMGLECDKQKPLQVYFKDKKVGEYFADIMVEDKVILELKASALNIAHEYQLLNYLKATDVEVGLLLSFGKDAVFKRKILKKRHSVRQKTHVIDTDCADLLREFALLSSHFFILAFFK